MPVQLRGTRHGQPAIACRPSVGTSPLDFQATGALKKDHFVRRKDNCAPDESRTGLAADMQLAHL